MVVPNSKGIADAREPTDRPRHPLVIDEVSGLARYATQDDIRRFEAICSAYKEMVADARERNAASDRLIEHLTKMISISNG